MAVMLAVVATAGYLYATAERRRPVEIVGAMVVSEAVIVEVRSCGGEPEITAIEESPREVRITVEASTRLIRSGSECADSIEAQLEFPLRDRLLIDGTSGQPVEVRGG